MYSIIKIDIRIIIINAILCVIALVLISGCAVYYTRYFTLDTKTHGIRYEFRNQEGIPFGKYFINPVVLALGHTTGDHEGIDDPEHYYNYGIAVTIYDTTATDTLGIRNEIMSCFNPKSIILDKSQMNMDTLVLESYRITCNFPNKPPIGVSYYYGTSYIPPDIDSLAFIVPLNYSDICSYQYENIVSDTIKFEMHKIDKESTGFWNP